jgi:hypothetical protein
MTHPRAIGFTDFQLQMIMAAAAEIPAASERSAFLVALSHSILATRVCTLAFIAKFSV